MLKKQNKLEKYLKRLDQTAQKANDPDFRRIWQEKINELQKEKEI